MNHFKAGTKIIDPLGGSMLGVFLTLQSRTLNFATSAGAMNRFALTKVPKFKLRDCITFYEKSYLDLHQENEEWT